MQFRGLSGLEVCTSRDVWFIGRLETKQCPHVLFLFGGFASLVRSCPGFENFTNGGFNVFCAPGMKTASLVTFGSRQFLGGIWHCATIDDHGLGTRNWPKT